MRKKKGDDRELIAEQLRMLAVKAHSNAVELVSEAELLFQHGHFARCLFLSQIAGEELGKCHIAMTSIPKLFLGKMNWLRFWQRFRSHKEKSGDVHFFEGFMSPHELESLETMAQTVSAMETAKMLSLYTEQMQDLALAPSDWAKGEIAGNALGWAKGRLMLFALHVLPLLDRDFMDTFTTGDMRKHLNQFVQAIGKNDGVVAKKLLDLMTDESAM
jgi:AbiV family abortive infection protein